MDETLKFQLAEGIEIENLSGIHEAYSMEKTADGYFIFKINVSAPNIIQVFRSLSQQIKEPGFFLIEVGTHESIEKQLRKNDTDPFHKDVYYLDGKSWEDIDNILSKFHYLLSQDGGVNFGFGSHAGHDEVFVSPYKIFYIYADEPSKYVTALKKLGFEKVAHLKTVWNNFTSESPGRRNVLTETEQSIWDMIEELKKEGLYLSERRED